MLNNVDGARTRTCFRVTNRQQTDVYSDSLGGVFRVEAYVQVI